MGDLIYQLGRCVAFRRIKHPHLPWITIRLPVILALIVVAGFALLPVQPMLFGSDGLNGAVLTLVATLPGFFIAALAAVSTFDREALDATMPTPTPRLDLRTRGQESEVELTMRMFLSHLFAYLTTYSFSLALLCLAAEALAPSIRAVIQILNHDFISLISLARLVYAAMVSWFLSNIMMATVFGMYFLAERMHRPNA